MRECQIIPLSCPTDERRRRRLDMANERIPEFNFAPTSFPFVPVPSMRHPLAAHVQRPWGSGSSTPTGEGEGEVSPGAAGASSDVPGAWPGAMGMERGHEDDEGGGGFVERMAERLAYGRRAIERPAPPKRHETV
jgi:serine/threonine-protein phosphatase 2B catalytic subunit